MVFIRILFVLCLFPLTACTFLSPEAEYIPDNEVLPAATLGKPYLFKISILGGRVFGGAERKAGIVEPDDTGIFVRNCKLPDSVITEGTRDIKDHNCVEVYGTPTKSGLIKINLSSGMYGNMFVPGSYFSKDYTLTVVSP
ncbi:hypothetical protein [Buttiauxella izardii]|uniref:Lipoprotein n=1 Tax=Buttiauxella izardii TaxID=82991 RepID=A0A3A5K6S3_9ENTR|nr:hypothetical protein [Buttiauxella izardii]RJT26570.1 hypothetical protein D6029_05915 [Buttiauxella izardii]